MNDRLWDEIGAVYVVNGVKFTCCFRGQINQGDLELILDNPDVARFIKLDHVYWIDRDEWVDGELVISPVRFGKDYLYKHFHRPMYLRIRDIVSIAALDGEADLAWMESAAVARDEACGAQKKRARTERPLAAVKGLTPSFID